MEAEIYKAHRCIIGGRNYSIKNKKQDDFHITLLRSDNLAESWQPELHVVFILRETENFCIKQLMQCMRAIFLR